MMCRFIFLAFLAIIISFPASVVHAKNTGAHGWTDSLWVSPDGRMVLFMYSRYNYFPLIKGTGSAILSGPDYLGHHKNNSNPWDDSDLYFVMKLPNGEWSSALNMPTNDDGGDCCAMIAGDEMFFQKGTDLFISTYQNEVWSKPEKISVNSPSIDTNPHFDVTTNVLYWASDRGGNMDIWFAKRLGKNEWTKPQPVPGDINTSAKEDQVFVLGDQMRFSREGQFGNVHSMFVDGKWTKGEPEPLGIDTYHAEPSFSEDGNTVWFTAADLENERLVFMKSEKSPDGTWGRAVPIDINLP